jgi:hypothetical protein
MCVLSVSRLQQRERARGGPHAQVPCVLLSVSDSHGLRRFRHARRADNHAPKNLSLRHAQLHAQTPPALPLCLSVVDTPGIHCVSCCWSPCVAKSSNTRLSVCYSEIRYSIRADALAHDQPVGGSRVHRNTGLSQQVVFISNCHKISL